MVWPWPEVALVGELLVVLLLVLLWVDWSLGLVPFCAINTEENARAKHTVKSFFIELTPWIGLTKWRLIHAGSSVSFVHG
jgi:hypothetical protein